MADSDSESIPTSDEEPEEELQQVDCAADMARRQAELRQQMNATPPPEKPKIKRVDPRGMDVYDMLPERYRAINSRPNTAASSTAAPPSRPATADPIPTAIVAPITDDAMFPPPPAEAPREPSPKGESPTLADRMKDLEAMVMDMHADDAKPTRAPPPALPDFSAGTTFGLDDLELDPAQLANMIDKDDDMVDKTRYQSATGEKFKGGQYWREKCSADHKFDIVSSVLEEMVESDEKFLRLQEHFKNKYCGVFEDVEENKLEYTDIHKKWVEKLETYIGKLLAKKVKGFRMDEFLVILEERGDEVSGDVWNLLLSFTDFQLFKQGMLNWKAGIRDEPSEVELSRKELAKMMNNAQNIMDHALDRAYDERQQALADAAVSNVLGF